MLVDAPFDPIPQKLHTPAAATTQAQGLSGSERAVQRLTLVIFWLVIMEGSLRKWVAPGFSHVLFFVRDPFVLLVYWYALRGGLFRNPSLFLKIGIAFACVAPLLAFAQIAQVGDSRMGTVVAYGWRQYFLYLPFPFVVARVMTEDFLWKLVRHVFIATILTAPLMFAQFESPPASVINRGSAEDEALQFKSFDLLGDKIRPSGFFTVNVGNNNLIPCTLSLLFAAWLTPGNRRRVRTPMLIVTAGATATCLALSGSRAAFAGAALVVLSSMLAGLLIRKATIRFRAIVIPGVLCGVGAVLYPILFPDAFETMLARATVSDTFGDTQGTYGIVGRALYETYDFIYLMGDSPLIGYGLGLGGNGRTYLGDEANHLLQNAYAESDWQRHIVDLGPVLGVLFIIFRIALSLDLVRRTIQATVRALDPFPVLLLGYVGIGVFYGQLTGHGTVGGFLWLFLGITLGASRIAMERASQAGVSARA